jgi:hypothetical protein
MQYKTQFDLLPNILLRLFFRKEKAGEKQTQP